MRRWLILLKDERGQVLPLVLVALVIGGLIAIPSLTFVSTNIKAGHIVEKNVKGIYAAEAGIEDAMWELRDGTWPASFPYTYTLPDQINSNNVAVTMEFVSSLYGKEIAIKDLTQIGPHIDTLDIQESFTYDDVNQMYNYVLTLIKLPDAGGHTGVLGIDWIAMDFPAGLNYESSLPSSVVEEDGVFLTRLPAPKCSDTSSGNRLVIIWADDKNTLFNMQVNPKETVIYTLYIQLTGPPGLDPTSGLIALNTRSADVGTITDYWPFVITAHALDSDGKQVSVRVGVWLDANIKMRDWEISP